MERRKILLGSGAALATVLAGCSSSETSDDENGDDDDPEDITGNGDDDNGNGDADGSETDETVTDDVPGFDGTKLDLDSDAVSVTKIDKKGDKLDVVVETEVTDREKLYAELAPLASKHDEATADLEAFASEIKTVEWVVDHDSKKVVSFYVDVDWIVDYREDELSDEEFLEKVKQTAE